MKFPLTLVPSNTNIDFIGMRRYAFSFSILITFITLIALFVKGINLGIDFTGGIIVEARSGQEFELGKLRDSLSDSGFTSATIQTVADSNTVIVRVQPKPEVSQTENINELKNIIASGVEVDFRKVDFVGPKVGSELISKGVMSLFFAILGIMIYVWIRFNLQFGMGAIIALAHDTFATLGFFVFMQYEFDLSSVAALLTILGFSINDTVVIYDRIRENLRKYKSKPVAEVVNMSINETLSRSIMTVATAALGCLALVMFGGDVIRGFSAAMMFGFIFGTYSSVYISAPILLYTKFGKAKLVQAV